MAKVSIDLGALQDIASEAAERGLKTALAVGERRLKADLLNREGQGKVYGRHRASAPGAPPAPDTDSLRDRTAADPDIQHDGPELVGRIVANTTYAHALEVGTERMAARPFMSTLRSDHAAELTAAFQAGAKG